MAGDLLFFCSYYWGLMFIHRLLCLNLIWEYNNFIFFHYIFKQSVLIYEYIGKYTLEYEWFDGKGVKMS